MFHQSWPVKMAYMSLFCKYINWAIFSPSPPTSPHWGGSFKKTNFVNLHHCYNWLPVAYQIVFKILLLTFKAINKLAPTYISELVSLKDSGGWGGGGK